MKNKKVHNITAPALHVDEKVSLEEQIAQRAHELWRQRGRTHGSDLCDWFQAEQEVRDWHHQRLQRSA